MRLCRFNDERLGIVEGPNVRDVTAALDVLPAYHYPLPSFDVLIANLDKVTARAKTLAGNSPSLPLTSVTLLSPVANPGKIIGAPVNYQKHLDEARTDAGIHHNKEVAVIHRAGVFLKATSSLVGAGEGIAVRKLDRRTDHEVELAFVIGKRAHNVSSKEALGFIAGYAICLDITVRGSEERSLRKSIDTYTVLGPWLVTAEEIPDPGQLDLKISVNGEVRQNSNTRNLIMNIPDLIEFASSFYTLHPGDIVTTGTPEGVSPISPGDLIVASIEKIGTMEVRVRAL
jgi:2-keto-4-pentenoate hydratase/2-oxohepta-3-ene-1,7-dioic acid hydratase in catechol pathway